CEVHMAVHDISGARFVPDFSEDEFLQAIECFINGAWYPRRDTQLTRISRVSAADTGPHGELVSAAPFFLCYRTGSFVPQLSASRIRGEREAAGIAGSESYCFTVTADPDSLECRTHNALFTLSGAAPAAYAVPLFYRRRSLAMFRQTRQSALSGDEGQDEKGKVLSAKSPLLHQSAVIAPDAREGKAESRVYISYDKNGISAVHNGGTARLIRQENFYMDSFLGSLLADSREGSLSDYADTLFASLPEIFAQTSASRKLKCIIENALYECIDERQLPAGISLQKGLDHLEAREKLVISEKLLRTHFGIIQYFRLKYRS
ncbi:MAG: hypothetical protein ACRCUT_05950, partial [Spirochaetota bacterium]